MIKLAHFTAKWCVPCKMMEPTIEKFLTDHPDVTYEKIDVDLRKNEARCNTDHILSMPTLIMLANDTQIWRVNHVVGARALKNAYTKAKSAEEGT